MEITFADGKIQKLCLQDRIAQKELGQACARKLRSRMDDLMAVDVLEDLVVGRPHPLKGDRLGQFALDLEGGRRLVFEPANEPIPLYEDGGVNRAKVTQVRIISVVNYHD